MAPSRYTSGRRTSWTPRIQPWPANEMRMNGAPQLAMRSHDTADSICTGSSPISSAAGRAISCSTPTTTMPIATASQVACTP